MNHRDATCQFDEVKHLTNRHVKQAVTVASIVTRGTISEMGKACNMECANIIVKDPALNRHDVKTADDLIFHLDCRLFKRFICFRAIRAAKRFKNAVSDDQDPVQVNIIYRKCPSSHSQTPRPAIQFQ